MVSEPLSEEALKALFEEELCKVSSIPLPITRR